MTWMSKTNAIRTTSSSGHLQTGEHGRSQRTGSLSSESQQTTDIPLVLLILDT